MSTDETIVSVYRQQGGEKRLVYTGFLTLASKRFHVGREVLVDHAMSQKPLRILPSRAGWDGPTPGDYMVEAR